MAADYDLVILGGTLAGREAALQATTYGARVALVEPPGLFLLNQRHRYLLQALQQVTRGRQAQGVCQWFEAQPINQLGHGRADWNWNAFLEWSAIAAETQDAHLSASALSAKGVDVVPEMPERLSKRCLVTTRSRQIKARAVLAAFGLSPDVFKPLLTATQLPKSVMIWGGGVRSLLWAEVLAQVGVQVTVQTVEVLPGWDEGVRTLVRSQLTQTGVVFLDPADADTTTAEQTLCFGTEQPALDLPKFVYHHSRRQYNSSPFLRINRKFQVGKSRLFACGAIIEGHREIATTRREVLAAVQNALFLPTRQIEPSQLIKTGHRFAMAGLTRSQAADRYGDRVRVWLATHAGSTDLSQVVPASSYCQLVCVGRRLVGVHLVGDRADDCIAIVATYLNQPITKLSNSLSSTSNSALMDLVHQAAIQHCQTQWEIGHWKRDWSENWFNWRRSRR